MVSRNHPRYAVRIEVNCSTKDMFLTNRVTNLSRGGLFMQSEAPMPLHSLVGLTLFLPDWQARIEATGRVVWSYDIAKGTSHLVCGNGIKFVDLAPDDRSLLEDYLDSLARPASRRSGTDA